ncbi:MAG: hypothetical protein ACYDC5_01605 [Candidatus Dormibacteria bacterium]
MAAQLLGDVVIHVAHQLEEILPAEARIHLIRAQRELLLAAVAALEHHQAREYQEPAETPRRRARRVRKISLD